MKSNEPVHPDTLLPVVSSILVVVFFIQTIKNLQWTVPNEKQWHVHYINYGWDYLNLVKKNVRFNCSKILRVTAI
jgi:hypothetical protein